MEVHAAADTSEVTVRVLGPLRVAVGGREVEFRAPMHRALVACLAVRPNAVVTAEVLIDDLWEGTPPDGARATLQSYVSVVRKKLREAGATGDVLSTRERGYVLTLSPESSDVFQFRTAIAAAKQRAASGDHERAYDHVREAASMVELPVLEELGHIDAIRIFVAEIGEGYRWATEQRIRAEIGWGRSGEVVAELRQLVQDHPLEERFWALLMQALHQSGRQTEALRAYQELRQTLSDAVGVEPAAELQALDRAILTGEFAADGGGSAVGARPRRRAAIPYATTRLVGRAEDMRELADEIEHCRVLTLAGSGGSGKTRLAVELGNRVAERYQNVVWVELNSVEIGAEVAGTIARALGIYQPTSDALVELIIDDLSSGRSLLVLDNCEHVVEDAALVVEALVARCRDLTVIATSREPLAVSGERVHMARPLATATPIELSRPSPAAAPTAAAELFLERAEAAAPGVLVDLALVEAVCVELDGMPLAIELAAPLLASMSLESLADQMRDRFRLLSETRRTGRRQHRTLRAVVAWSHDLMDDDERALFAALSVCRGSFGPQVVDALAASVGVEPGPALRRLVHQSVVLHERQPDGSSRYSMLETLRAFASEQLETVGEPERVRGAFVDLFTASAVRWQRSAQTAASTAWIQEFGADVANFQNAVALARRIDPARALQLIPALRWQFNFVGQLPETQAWLDGHVSDGNVDPELRAEVLLTQACLANFGGQYGDTARYAEDALEAARQLDDPVLICDALLIRGTTAVFEGEVARAAECFTEALPLCEELGDDGGAATAMVFQGTAHRRMGRFDEAQRCFDVSWEAFTRLGDDRGMSLVLGNLGRLAQQQGHLAQARSYCDEAMSVAFQSLDPMVTAQTALFSGHVHFDERNFMSARDDFMIALNNALALTNHTLTSASLEWLVLAGGGRDVEVSTIDAFTLRHRAAPETSAARPEWDEAVARAKTTLEPAEHQVCVDRGNEMTLDEAVAFARRASGIA